MHDPSTNYEKPYVVDELEPAPVLPAHELRQHLLDLRGQARGRIEWLQNELERSHLTLALAEEGLSVEGAPNKVCASG